MNNQRRRTVIHPEWNGESGFEPTVGEQLRLREAWLAIDRAEPEQLRALCRQLAQQVLVVQPAAMRWLAREAAQNLAGQPWTSEQSDRLVAALELPSPEGA